MNLTERQIKGFICCSVFVVKSDFQHSKRSLSHTAALLSSKRSPETHFGNSISLLWAFCFLKHRAALSWRDLRHSDLVWLPACSMRPSCFNWRHPEDLRVRQLQHKVSNNTRSVHQVMKTTRLSEDANRFVLFFTCLHEHMCSLWMSSDTGNSSVLQQCGLRVRYNTFTVMRLTSDWWKNVYQPKRAHWRQTL